jgi:hypothetical protein
MTLNPEESTEVDMVVEERIILMKILDNLDLNTIERIEDHTTTIKKIIEDHMMVIDHLEEEEEVSIVVITKTDHSEEEVHLEVVIDLTEAEELQEEEEVNQ